MCSSLPFILDVETESMTERFVVSKKNIHLSILLMPLLLIYVLIYILSNIIVEFVALLTLLYYMYYYYSCLQCTLLSFFFFFFMVYNKRVLTSFFLFLLMKRFNKSYTILQHKTCDYFLRLVSTLIFNIVKVTAKLYSRGERECRIAFYANEAAFGEKMHRLLTCLLYLHTRLALFIGKH